MDKLKLIIGLGNPDKEYENTYHNVGLLFVNHLNKNLDKFPDTKLSAVESNAYMNNSGNFVNRQMRKHGVKTKNLAIVHDDSDLKISKFKIQFARGAAGHKGVLDIQKTLKTGDFWRIRIGIRPLNEKIRQKAEKFVLKKITQHDKKILSQIFDEIINNMQKQILES